MKRIFIILIMLFFPIMSYADGIIHQDDGYLSAPDYQPSVQQPISVDPNPPQITFEPEESPLIYSGPKGSSDLSTELNNARPWPHSVKHFPGEQKIWAPPGTITEIAYAHRMSKSNPSGNVYGSNSKGHWVWAVPCKEAGGTRWEYKRVGTCNNPCGGQLFCPKKKVYCPPPTPQAVCQPLCLPEFVPCEPQDKLCLEEVPICPPTEVCAAPVCEQPSGAYSFSSEGERHEIPVGGIFGSRERQKKVKEEETCPPLQPGDPRIPNPPPPNSPQVLGTGNPSGQIPNPPATDIHQPSPAHPGGHQTGGNDWDPDPDDPHIADPVN